MHVARRNPDNTDIRPAHRQNSSAAQLSLAASDGVADLLQRRARYLAQHLDTEWLVGNGPDEQVVITLLHQPGLDRKSVV